MFQLSGKKISLDVDLTVGAGDDAITYPAGSLRNAELRAGLGIVEVADPVRPDERLFFVTENEDGSFAATPRPRDQVTAPVWERIKAMREQVKEGGVMAGGKWFHTDAASRIQHLGLLRLADATRTAGGVDATALTNPANGAVIEWKTMDGTMVPMTCKLAEDVFAADAVLDFTAHAAAEAHKAAMELSENPFDYDFSTGWPGVYVPAP